MEYLGILWYPIMENQMEKKTENEMETEVIWGLYWGCSKRMFGTNQVRPGPPWSHSLTPPPRGTSS